MINNIKLKTYQLLKWSEKWTKTDMIYLSTSGFWMISGHIINSASSLALSIAYANLIPKEAYALYKYVISMASLLSIPNLPGINTALDRAIALGYDGSIKKGLILKLKWGIFSFLAGIGVSIYYFYQGNTLLGISFLAAAIFIPLSDATSIYSSLLLGKKLFKKSSIYNVVSQTTTAFITLIILLVLPKIIFIILFYYFSSFIRNAVLLYITNKKYKSNNLEDPDMVSFGKHLSLMGILNTIAEQIDKILMWHFLGPINLAIYSFAVLPINQISSFLKSVPALAFPKLAIQDTENIKKTLPGKMAKFALLLILPVSVYILTAPYAYRLLFPEYMDSVFYSQIFVLSLLLFPSRLLGEVFTAKASKKVLYILKISTPLSKIISMSVFIPIFGIIGAIYSMLLTSVFSTIIQIYYFKKLR